MSERKRGRAGVALALLLAASFVTAACDSDTTGSQPSADGPLVVPPAHGWSWTVDPGQTFTDGLEVLTVTDQQALELQRVELMGDPDLKLVGAMIAPPPRRISASQVFERWPPAGHRIFDPDTLVNAEGAEIGSSNPRDNRMGWELLLGIQPTSAGLHHRTGIRIYYRSDGVDYVAEIPAELTVCAGEQFQESGRCPLN